VLNYELKNVLEVSSFWQLASYGVH